MATPLRRSTVPIEDVLLDDFPDVSSNTLSDTSLETSSAVSTECAVPAGHRICFFCLLQAASFLLCMSFTSRLYSVLFQFPLAGI